jgi:hypothetical protein
MLLVYVHKIKSEEKQTVDKIMVTVGIKDYEIIDLMVRTYDTINPTPCITIGTIADRIVRNKLHAFPDFKEFTGPLTEAKRELRQKVLVSLKGLVDILQTSVSQSEKFKQVDEKVFEKPHTLEEFKKMWFDETGNAAISYIIINSANKRICIYNCDKPEINVDIYYTVAEFAALLDIADRFGAKNLLIHKANDKGEHEI